ncbi:MAG: LysM peptidoglycan-binding domain-containing protein [Chloroflexota bacterium]|nr:MAG: LysM peptidoglycan-binding domain-containing protein [Chloroflexota bacterium]
MARYLVAGVVCALAFLQLAGVARGQDCAWGSHQISYVVRSGDSLTALANQYELSIDDLVSVNPSLNSRSMVLIGQTLKVPVCDDPPAPSSVAQSVTPSSAAKPPAPDPAMQSLAPSPAAQSPVPSPSPQPPATDTAAQAPAPAAAPSQATASTNPAPARSPQPSAAPQASQAAQPARNPEPSASTHPIAWDKAADSLGIKGEPGTGVESLLASEAPKAVFVILLAGGAMWLLRRYWGRQPRGGVHASHLTVIETRKLGTRHALYVVSYGSRILLIGAAQGNISLLADLAPQQGSLREADKLADDASGDFAEHLAQAANDPSNLGELRLASPMRDLVARIRDTAESLHSKTNRLREFRSQLN